MASKPHPWLHRIAASAVCVALVTLTFGALVTTKHAGMAFADWPTSDGYLMVTYPWLSDFAKNWDKFLEHGHRLAGMVIGIWSILMVVATWRLETRRWVRGLSVSILLGVICQGLLGGFRVQLDERGLAMIHGMFAAVVFSLMGITAAVTNPRWERIRDEQPQQPSPAAKFLAVAVVVTLGLQYVLGSLIRHHGSGLHEHLGLGILALGLIIANAVVAGSAHSVWLKRAARGLLLTACGQVILGLSTWVAKYGLASVGYVAVADSIGQVSLRTGHMVWGVVTFMAAAVYCVKVFRVARVAPRLEQPVIEIRRPGSALVSKGGAV